MTHANGGYGLQVAMEKRLAFYTVSLAFSCSPGETLVLTGPSGSGKTTVLRCIAGLEAIDAGRIYFDGEIWNDTETGARISAQARGIGLVSQNSTLFPHMSVAQNIAFAMPKPGNPESMLASLGIGHLRDRRPAAISGGERQRVALGQALSRLPRLLLLDEPFSALDIENRHTLRLFLSEIQKQRNLAIVQVTHDLVEAFTFPGRIISLNNGGNDPAWLERQKLLLAPPMNRWCPDTKNLMTGKS